MAIFSAIVVGEDLSGFRTHGRSKTDDPKWDVFRVGGMFSGFFLLHKNAVGFVTPGLPRHRIWKCGKTADHCPWSSVDLEGARDQAEAEARELFHEWMALCDQHGRPRELSYFLEEGADGPAELCSLEKYEAQKALRAFWKTHSESFFCPVETLGFDEEAYIAEVRTKVMVPDAIVLGDTWHERGEKSWEEWSREVWDHLKKESPQSRLTILECSNSQLS